MSHMEVMFTAVRQRSVQIQRTFRMVVTKRNTGIPKAEWQERNPGVCPLAAGHLIVPVQTPFGEVDHVVTKKGEGGEVDIDFEISEGVTLTCTSDPNVCFGV